MLRSADQSLQHCQAPGGGSVHSFSFSWSMPLSAALSSREICHSFVHSRPSCLRSSEHGQWPQSLYAAATILTAMMIKAANTGTDWLVIKLARFCKFDHHRCHTDPCCIHSGLLGFCQCSQVSQATNQRQSPQTLACQCRRCCASWSKQQIKALLMCSPPAIMQWYTGHLLACTALPLDSCCAQQCAGQSPRSPSDATLASMCQSSS